LYEIQNLYYTGHVTQRSGKEFRFMVTLEANTPEGTYRFNDAFLRANNISYVHFDDCLLRLTKEAVQLNVFCKPKEKDIPQNTTEQADIKLGSVF